MVIVNIIGTIEKFEPIAISKKGEALRHALSMTHITNMGNSIMRHGKFSPSIMKKPATRVISNMK